MDVVKGKSTCSRLSFGPFRGACILLEQDKARRMIVGCSRLEDEIMEAWIYVCRALGEHGVVNL